MRYFIISDIHGSPVYLKKALTLFKEGNYDYLIILGDILYHGPRNKIPEGYDPQEVVNLLNPLSRQIIACRGNCEAEVDQMLLTFPCLGDYNLIVEGDVSLFATHGHKYTSENFPIGPGKQCVFLSGHTHLWLLEQKEHLILCNPGSITLPKENRPHTYATYENRTLSILDFEGHVLSRLTLESQ